MTAGALPVQRPVMARLLVVDSRGRMKDRPRSELVDVLRAGDVVIANDAATLPASLFGVHRPTGRAIEVRLAGRGSLSPELTTFAAVVFGEGDFRVRTEDRPQPPQLRPGDRLQLGPLVAEVREVHGHPRFISLEFAGSAREIREGLARYGRPIQYSHVRVPLETWDTWTPIAGPPVAFEPPSAGFVLDWSVLQSMAQGRVRFATITHAAGISSTGDAQLDDRLPLDEPYRIPQSTARLVEEARRAGRRVIAIGTTVVRALEHAAAVHGVVRGGEGMATQRIGPGSRLGVVSAIVSGTHEPGTSHYELLRAFASDATLGRMDAELNRLGYRTHEFGDSIFLERSK